MLRVYDKPDALSYLEPPYYGTERYYNAEFKEEDHLRLNKALKGLKGKFLLSYNDCDFIRELYKDFTIEGISRNHNLTGRYVDAEHNYREVLIRNY